MKFFFFTLYLLIAVSAIAQDSTHIKHTNYPFSSDSIVEKRSCQIIEVGTMVGIANHSGALFDLQTTFGKRVKRHLFWGAGLGFDITHYKVYYDSPFFIKNFYEPYFAPTPAILFMLSITGDMKYYFMSKRISPFIGEDIGGTYYNLSTLGEAAIFDANGFPLQQATIRRNGAGARSITEIGFKYYLSNKIGFGLSVSYLLQYLQAQISAPEQAVNGVIDPYQTQTHFYNFMQTNFILNFN